jgi:type VI protein secretion system component VasF
MTRPGVARGPRPEHEVLQRVTGDDAPGLAPSAAAARARRHRLLQRVAVGVGMLVTAVVLLLTVLVVLAR